MADQNEPPPAHQPGPTVQPEPRWTGPQWIGPQGLGQPTPLRSDGVGLPYLDDDEPQRPVGRRRALAAFGGTAAVVAGGVALGLSPQVRGLFGDAGPTVAGDATGPTVTDGTPARPSGQQASTVRTYTEQNESYMGSRAGKELRRNTPTGGRSYSGPAAAAEATKVTVKTVLAKDPVLHLARRATFGATPRLVAEIRKVGIDAWIRTQLEPAKIAPTRGELKLADLPTLKLNSRQLRDQREQLDQRGAQPEKEVVDATIARQIWSDRQLFEVMVDFWNDFLHVAADFDGGGPYRTAFDRDVVRAHALGSYPEMLVAANRHPALLLYLNQNDSRADAVNENLARENLELYSVGVDGGYREKDVRQAALLQTGRGVDDGEYVFRPDRHYVGKVKILGFSHANDSADPKKAEAAIDAYLTYLALHPSTAKYVAQNLAVRFVSDTPPKSLVDRLAKTYTANRGRIRPVLMTLFSSSEFWAAVGQKVRRPLEYLVATYRVLGVAPDASPGHDNRDNRRTPYAQGLRQVHDKLRELGHHPMGQPTPDGYPDVYLAWTSAGTMVNGWNEAGDLLTGRRTQFTYTAAERLVADPPGTAGAYVDALARRLVQQKLTTRERELILDIAGVPAGAKVDATLGGAVVAVARAILASPQHHLR
ncbi:MULTISPECIES: DUF1800 domain-containing protein [Micromonospora]|uniref:Uncharacterized conserved protein, DUF1800 family n=1 Tax=Micromonospora yangpuensis TaxID=683228 RepID=A0A1C6V290_9ACTN|nr:DUF1800 domain-containing protein [Micromonospora yangpuensis]GGL98021.1 hypothetical protein GCM10012279_14350 [Micromonospora yangpuensis]SCL60267.1 Uncharacterized conserved protein, DUF1800 family [Micromonospora yangpuensis]